MHNKQIHTSPYVPYIEFTWRVARVNIKNNKLRPELNVRHLAEDLLKLILCEILHLK